METKRKRIVTTLDKFGNVVDAVVLEAHIPIEEFVFRD
jgi:hypothetical protein